MVAAARRGGGGAGGAGGGNSRCWRAGLLPLPGALLLRLLLLLLGAASPPPVAQGRRLICWQAMLQCQEEAECGYAFSQYYEACAPVLKAVRDGSATAATAPSSSRRRCPSHCISALIQLNHTRRGPALEDCDCDQDENCRATKRAIEPCLPRTSGSGGGGGIGGGAGGAGAGGVIGCTEARRRCDWDSQCNLALHRYMTYCGKLFNGLRCTEECRAVIQDMLAVPKALLLNECVCDGLERPICETVKENMARLCFGAEPGGNGAGSSGASDGALDDDYEDEYDYEHGQRGDFDEAVAVVKPVGKEPRDHGCLPRAAPWTRLSAASILLLLLLSS